MTVEPYAMSMLPWTLLNILAWSLGVKAVHDLSADFDPQLRRWFFLGWSVRLCLAMEIAMLGAGRVAGLDLVSVITGILSGLLIWLGFRSFQEDVCRGESRLPRGSAWDRAAASFLAAGTVLCVLAGAYFPRSVHRLVGLLNPLEGGVWLLASSWWSIGLAVFSCPKTDVEVYEPRVFSLAFLFAFLHASLRPLAFLLDVSIPPEAGALLGTLFVLTLTMALYGAGIRSRSRKLAQAMSQLNELQENLFEIEKISAVGAIAAGAAHDFNNNLTSILFLTELLLRDPGLPEHMRQDMESIKNSTLSAAATTERLRGLARRQAAKCPYLTLREAVEKPLEVLAKDLARNRIQIVKRFGEIPRVTADLCLVSQVCLNLYLNARDAMKPKGGGTLRVSLQGAGGQVEIAVEDTGAGVPKEFQPKLFQPFQTTKGEKGTGLGLSASRSLIKSMDGDMGFETVEGAGAKFWIRLPLGLEGDGHDRPIGDPKPVQSRELPPLRAL